MAECQFQGQVRRRTRSCYNGSDKVQIENCGTSEHQDIHICKVPLPSPVGKPTEQPQRTKKMGDLVEIDHNLDQRTNSSKTDASSRTNDTPEEDQKKKEFVILNLASTTTSQPDDGTVLPADEEIDMEHTTSVMDLVITSGSKDQTTSIKNQEDTDIPSSSSTTELTTETTTEATTVSIKNKQADHTFLSTTNEVQTTATRPYPIVNLEQPEEPQYETLIYEYFEPPDTTEKPVTRPNYSSLRWWYTYFLLRFFS